MSPAQRREFFARLQRANPAPASELRYRNPFQLLVAVVLSAQATDVSVNKATESLFRVVSKPEDLIRLGVRGLKPYIRTIGLYNGKAKNLVAAASLLLERHGGEVPAERAALEALPGVGRKTANVILNTAFGAPVIAVDTHVFRVANRTGLAPGRTVLAVEKALMRAVPEEYRRHAHHWLILHGRYTCKARKPLCEGCPVSELCAHRRKALRTARSRAD